MTPYNYQKLAIRRSMEEGKSEKWRIVSSQSKRNALIVLVFFFDSTETFIWLY
jgi:hypothetical protein